MANFRQVYLRNSLGTSTADPSSIWWKELMIFWYFNSWGWGGLQPGMTLLETPRFELQCSWHVTTTKQHIRKKIIIVIIMIVSDGRLIKLWLVKTTAHQLRRTRTLQFLLFIIERLAKVLLLHLDDGKILFYLVNKGYTSILLQQKCS